MQRNQSMMRPRLATAALAIGMAVAAAACSESKATPTSATPAPIEVVPKFTAPSIQSPNNDEVLGKLSATLTSSAATVDVATLTPQYRFQVLSSSGALVLDSGLVGAPSWQTGTLLPNTRFTWKVRGEAQGWAGPWSSAGSFKTPDPPPAYGGSIGNWQACAGLRGGTLVGCVWTTIRPTNSVGDLEVAKRVAWLLRGEGAGLLIKTGGENVVLWQGYSFSATRICFPDGHIYKIIGDAGPGGANSPGWSDNDFVDKSLYVPAIDPNKP